MLPSDDLEDGCHDEALLEWAARFIRRLAKGRYPRLHSLERFRDDEHRALAEMLPWSLRNHRWRVRQAGAWVLSQLHFQPLDYVELLGGLFTDPHPLVRASASWAVGELGEDAIPLLPWLIAAMGDHHKGVRFAAISALKELGPLAAESVPALVRIAQHGCELEKTAATRAIAFIHPTHAEVQSTLLNVARSGNTDGLLFAVYGLGRAAISDPHVIAVLVERLDDEDAWNSFFTVWALGRFGDSAFEAVPGVLKKLQESLWITIPDEGVRLNVRPDVVDALDDLVPMGDDELFHDFRKIFFQHAFHPQPLNDARWIETLVQHPWYLKVQRRRFPNPLDREERNVRNALVEQAQDKFTIRLLRNPTLGLTPEKWPLLPGYIRNHTRNIAWRSRKKQQQSHAQLADGELEQVAVTTNGPFPFIDQELLTKVWDFITTKLSEEEAYVALFRWRLGWSLKETAAAMGLSKSQVMTREKNARAALRSQFGEIDS